MTDFWQWFLIIGGVIIFITNVLLAIFQLTKFLKNGKKNADNYFEKRVRTITGSCVKSEIEIFQKDREIEFQIMREFISSELKPIKEDIQTIKVQNQNLQHATLTNLKIKLRAMYYDIFEPNGVFSQFEKSNWDKWFSDYTCLGGNSDIKTMNDHVQKVYLEITLEKQKAKAKTKSNKSDKKGGEQP